MAGLVGELAALGTAAFFAVSSTLFTLAGRRVGSTTVNRTRLAVATVFVGVIHWWRLGSVLPLGAPPRAWLWLGLSGVVGLAVGDALLFQAFVMVGTALSMLVFALAPILTALLGFLFFDERLSPVEWLGIGVTISGIAWVVTEPRRRAFLGESRSYLGGILFAVGGALGQALGLIAAKAGLAEGVSALSGNVMRLLAATVAIWIVPVVSGGLLRTVRSFRAERRALGLVTAAAVVGPVVGVWLSLVAIERAPIGIASTLMSLTPIFLLPIARIVFSEPITYRAVAGTVVALAGAALLFR